MAKLDKKEKELLESVERGKWKTIRGVKGEVKRYQEYAEATFKKDRRVNLYCARYSIRVKKTRISA